MEFPPRVPLRLTDSVVTLSNYTEADAVALFEALADPLCWEHIPRAIPTTAYELHDQIATRLDGHRITYTIVHDGQVVGTTSIIDIGDPDGVEVGATQLTPTVWGSGVNQRSKELLTDALFAAGCAWVQFRTDERNHRSAAAICRLGAVELGVRPDTLVRRDGSRRASVFFRLYPHYN